MNAHVCIWVYSYEYVCVCVYMCVCVCVSSVCHTQMRCVYLVCVAVRMCLVRTLHNSLWLYLACVSRFSVCHRKLYACVQCVLKNDVKTHTYLSIERNPAPGGSSILSGIQMKSPEEEDPPWKTIHQIHQYWGLFFQGIHYKVCTVVVRVFLVYVIDEFGGSHCNTWIPISGVIFSRDSL